MNITSATTKTYEHEQPGEPGQNKTNFARARPSTFDVRRWTFDLPSVLCGKKEALWLTKKCQTNPIFEGQKTNISSALTKDYENDNLADPAKTKPILPAVSVAALPPRNITPAPAATNTKTAPHPSSTSPAAQNLSGPPHHRRRSLPSHKHSVYNPMAGGT